MAETTKEFQDEHLQVKAEFEPGCCVNCTIKVEPVAYQAAQEKAVKNVRKNVSIPGFRKGKVPLDTVMKQYPKEIDREFRDLLVQTSVTDALKLAELNPLRQGKQIEVDIKENDPKTGATITASFEIAPDVPSIDSSSIKLDSIAAEEVKEEQIQEHLEALQFQHAEWSPVEGRGALEGDYADLDLFIEDEGKKQPIAENRRFHLQKERAEQWLLDLVIGQSEGAELKGVRDPSKDPSLVKEDEPKDPKTILVHIKSLQTAELPPIDDAFAEKLKLQSLDELKEKVRQHLEQKEMESVQTKRRNDVQSKLLSVYTFDLPLSLIEQETGVRMNHYLSQFDDKDQDNIEAAKKELEQQARKASEDSIRIYYLLGRYIGEKNIEVNEQEILQELMKKALYENPSILQDKEGLERYKSQIANDLLIQKALDHVAKEAS